MGEFFIKFLPFYFANSKKFLIFANEIKIKLKQLEIMVKRTIKLNGTLKVGLGQSKSGEVLDGNTQYVHFYTSKEDEIKQIKKLNTALRWHKANRKPMFYSHNGRAYQEVKAEWIVDRMCALQKAYTENNDIDEFGIYVNEVEGKVS